MNKITLSSGMTIEHDKELRVIIKQEYRNGTSLVLILTPHDAEEVTDWLKDIYPL